MIVNLINNILFFHLILQVLLVGLILGLFRTVIPALAEVDFGVPKGSFIFLSTIVFLILLFLTAIHLQQR